MDPNGSNVFRNNRNSMDGQLNSIFLSGIQTLRVVFPNRNKPLKSLRYVDDETLNLVCITFIYWPIFYEYDGSTVKSVIPIRTDPPSLRGTSRKSPDDRGGKTFFVIKKKPSLSALSRTPPRSLVALRVVSRLWRAIDKCTDNIDNHDVRTYRIRRVTAKIWRRRTCV